MEIFFDSYDSQAHPKFLSWTENNPEGFVVCDRGNDNPMLHHGNCSHLIWKSRPDYSMTRKLKACSHNRAELERWVSANLNKKIQICSDCKV
jgi:hypothetical protein